MTPLPSDAPVVALLPWGDVVEDYLESAGLTLAAFAGAMEGGWLFGYVEALRRAGVRTALVVVSRDVRAPTRLVHAPTGSALWALPVPRAFGPLRRRMRNPFGWTHADMFGADARLPWPARLVVRHVTPYLATPPRALARALRAEGARAVLVQEYEDARFDVASVVAARLGLPVFATFQGGNFQRSRIERVLRPRTVRRAAGFVVPDPAEADRLRARYGVADGRIARLLNPLDVAAWVPLPRADARAALGVPDVARVAVWRGRVDVHRKGLDVLLDAWARVTAARPGRDLRLRLVGTGTGADRLRARLAAGDAPGVDWHDAFVLDRDALRRHLATGDVYVLPSRHEGAPVALAEALAAGLPVVAAAAPGVRALVEGAAAPVGTVVPVGDADALAAALGALLDDPDRARRMGAAARRHAEATFSLDAFGQALRAFLFGPG